MVNGPAVTRTFTAAEMLEMADSLDVAGRTRHVERVWTDDAAAMLRQAALETGWYRAIDEASVCWEMAVAPTDDPKLALHNLIAQEVEVALDPLVSERARALQATAGPKWCGEDNE